ncbi:hypothetical protein HMPREF3232_01059 [Fannyhessea vaginae]|nr:hypothetical protein HMPREF3232_01059 [Fannyhessea vaginae]
MQQQTLLAACAFKQKLKILPTKIDALQQTPRAKALIVGINQQMLSISRKCTTQNSTRQTQNRSC